MLKWLVLAGVEQGLVPDNFTSLERSSSYQITYTLFILTPGFLLGIINMEFTPTVLLPTFLPPVVSSFFNDVIFG